MIMMSISFSPDNKVYQKSENPAKNMPFFQQIDAFAPFFPVPISPATYAISSSLLREKHAVVACMAKVTIQSDIIGYRDEERRDEELGVIEGRC